MVAYVIFIRDKMNDPEEFKIYQQKAPLARAGHALTPRVFYGDYEVLEGLESDGGAVVLEFQTMDEARAWYNSPAYQEAKAHRNKAADYRAILVQGV